MKIYPIYVQCTMTIMMGQVEKMERLHSPQKYLKDGTAMQEN